MSVNDLPEDVISRSLLRTERAATLLALICLAALILRVAYRVHAGGDDFWQNGYLFFYEYAKNIAAGKGLWLEGGGYAMRPPVYPYFLALAYLLGGHYLLVVIPQALVGTVTVACAYLIGKELFSERAGLIAALFTAFYPYYVVHDTALQETSMVTALAALSVYALLRAKRSSLLATWLLAGLVLGATVLTRATMLPFALAASVWIAALGAGQPRQKLLRAGVVLCGLALLVGSWLVRNDVVIGRPILTSELGNQFWTANNPQTFSRYPGESMDESRDVAFQALSAPEKQLVASLYGNELALNDFFMAKGIAYVRDNPEDVLVDGLRKVAAGFSWTINPNREPLVQAVYFLSYAPILVLGLLGMVLARRGWREHGLMYLQFLSFVAVTAVFWAHTSHRTYLDVYLILFSAYAVDRLITERLRAENRSNTASSVISTGKLSRPKVMPYGTA